MSLYGDRNISVKSLKRWVNSLSIDSVKCVNIGGNQYNLGLIERDLLNSILQTFSQLINNMKEGDDWRDCQHVLNSMFCNAFIRVDNSAIRIGDYFECLIIPSNIKTYKKIIKGVNYLDIGSINIMNKDNNLIATIGQKSDLIWSVFYDYFINKDDLGFIDHVYSNHEQYMSIQLFGVEGYSVDEIYLLINELLLYASLKCDMEFKVFEVDPLVKKYGDDSIYNLEYQPMKLERIPMLYMLNAVNSNDERLSYLSYYQVIEYFYVRAQNYYFLKEFNLIDKKCVNHLELRKILNDYKKVTSERESLRLVLNKAINIDDFKIWITSNDRYMNTYCNDEKYSIDISKENNKVISALAERIYNYRCSIVHSKGDFSSDLIVPFLDRKEILAELPLIKYVAYEVVKNCSEVE